MENTVDTLFRDAISLEGKSQGRTVALGTRQAQIINQTRVILGSYKGVLPQNQIETYYTEYLMELSNYLYTNKNSGNTFADPMHFFRMNQERWDDIRKQEEDLNLKSSNFEVDDDGNVVTGDSKKYKKYKDDLRNARKASEVYLRNCMKTWESAIAVQKVQDAAVTALDLLMTKGMGNRQANYMIADDDENAVESPVFFDQTIDKDDIHVVCKFVSPWDTCLNDDGTVTACTDNLTMNVLVYLEQPGKDDENYERKIDAEAYMGQQFNGKVMSFYDKPRRGILIKVNKKNQYVKTAASMYDAFNEYMTSNDVICVETNVARVAQGKKVKMCVRLSANQDSMRAFFQPYIRKIKSINDKRYKTGAGVTKAQAELFANPFQFEKKMMSFLRTVGSQGGYAYVKNEGKKRYCVCIQSLGAGKAKYTYRSDLVDTTMNTPGKTSDNVFIVTKLADLLISYGIIPLKVGTILQISEKDRKEMSLKTNFVQAVEKKGSGTGVIVKKRGGKFRLLVESLEDENDAERFNVNPDSVVPFEIEFLDALKKSQSRYADSDEEDSDTDEEETVKDPKPFKGADTVLSKLLDKTFDEGNMPIGFLQKMKSFMPNEDYKEKFGTFKTAATRASAKATAGVKTSSGLGYESGSDGEKGTVPKKKKIKGTYRTRARTAAAAA